MSRGGNRRQTGERNRAIIQLAVTLLLAGVQLAGVQWSVAAQSLPETSEARRAMLSQMVAPIGQHQSVERTIVTQRRDAPVLMRTEYQNDSVYYVFIPATTEDMHLAQPGSVIVRRRLSDGAFEQIKIFLQHDDGSFVRIRPRGALSEFDLYLAGALIHRNVPLTMSMERVLTAPLSAVLTASASVVDWTLLAPDTFDPGYRQVASLATEITAWAGDRTNPWWPAAALNRAITGTDLSFELVDRRYPESRGTRWRTPLGVDEPYRYLDITRTVSVHIGRAVVRPYRAGFDSSVAEIEAHDVRSVPFVHYTEDVGYPLREALRAVYWLALTEPGTVYLASVSRPVGSRTVQQVHTELAVILPWFKENGSLQVAVVTPDGLTDLRSYVAAQPGDFVHLTRVHVVERTAWYSE